MTSTSVPNRWLIPKEKPGIWIFQCGTNLPNLVKTHQAAVYFKKIVTLLEEDNRIVDYHLKFQHNHGRSYRLDVCVYFNGSKRAENPEALPICVSCDPENELSRASLLEEHQHHRTWLDGRARKKLIVTPIRHVERLLDLTDEEMETYWANAVDLIQRETSVSLESYPNLILNHGTYRTYCHLHLKINFREDVWQETIAIHHQKQLQNLKKICQNAELVKECFGTSKVHND